MKEYRLDGGWLSAQPALSFAVDAKGLVRTWNAALARSTGLHAEETIGRPVAELFGEPAAALLESARKSPQAEHFAAGFTVSPVLDSGAKFKGAWLRLAPEPGDSFRAVCAELLDCAGQVTAGNLDARIEAARFEKEGAEVAAGFNRMLDTLVPPLRAAARALGQIASGCSPEFLTEDYGGQFNDIKADINSCVAVMYGLHNEIRDLIEAVKAGRLDARGNDWDFQGRWRDLIAGLNELIDSFMGPFNVTADYVNRIAHGSIPDPIATRYAGDFNRIRRNLNLMVNAVNALSADVNELCASAVAGELGRRADASRHEGDFRAIVQGINDTLDGVVAPLAGSARVLAAVAAGDFTQRLEGEYRGFYASLQQDINKMAGNLQSSLQRIRSRAQEVGLSSEQLTGISSQMHAAADQTATRAQAASGASQAVAAGIRSLADGAEQTRVSMREIADHTQRLVAANNEAAARADSAFQTISRAGQAGSAIGAVIQSIGSIAAQTSALSENARNQAETADRAARGFGVVADEVKRLSNQIKDATESLGRRVKEFEAAREIKDAIDQIYRLAFHTGLVAINAAVEAARASDSGVRFGAVAAEIAELARNTTKAAGDVTQQLGAVRSGTSEAVGSIRVIVDTVEQLRQAADAIAHAAGERVETAEAMASAASGVAAGTDQISGNISGVAGMASQTTKGAEDTARQAATLAQMAEELNRLVGQFRV